MVCVTLFLIMTLLITSLRGDTTEEFPVQGCPNNPSTIVNDKVVAGYRYDKAGNNIPQFACNGNAILMNAETYYHSQGQCFKFGSMIVNPGCEVLFFDFRNGKMEPIDVFYQGTYGKVEINQEENIACIKAYLTTCNITYPACTPNDRWETITELDNTQGKESTTFSYTKTVGTTFSTKITESFGVSRTLKEEITASFFQRFKITLEEKSTTSFDWGKTDINTMSESTSSEVTQIVPPGKKFSIQQAVGHCGGSTVNTPLLKSING